MNRLCGLEASDRLARGPMRAICITEYFKFWTRRLGHAHAPTDFVGSGLQALTDAVEIGVRARQELRSALGAAREIRLFQKVV